MHPNAELLQVHLDALALGDITQAMAALVTVHATRGGTPTEWQSVDLYHVRDGRISEHWVHEVDQELVDRYWSETKLER